MKMDCDRFCDRRCPKPNVGRKGMELVCGNLVHFFLSLRICFKVGKSGDCSSARVPISGRIVEVRSFDTKRSKISNDQKLMQYELKSCPANQNNYMEGSGSATIK